MNDSRVLFLSLYRSDTVKRDLSDFILSYKRNVKVVILNHLFVAESNCSCFSREAIASSSFPIWKYDLSMRWHRQILKFMSLGVSWESGLAKILLVSTGREFFSAKSTVCTQSLIAASYFSSCHQIITVSFLIFSSKKFSLSYSQLSEGLSEQFQKLF